MRLSSCLLASLLIVATLFILQSAHAVRPTLPPEHPPIQAPVSSWLRLNQRAGLVFAGTVLRVQRIPAQYLRDLETIEISFHVENAIRGVRTGQTLSIREWAGLWVTQPRYRVGERVVLFLYPPSRLGLTSTVSNGGGRFVITPGGRVRLSPAQRSLLATEDISPQHSPRDAIPLSDFLQKIRGVEGARP